MPAAGAVQVHEVGPFSELSFTKKGVLVQLMSLKVLIEATGAPLFAHGVRHGNAGTNEFTVETEACDHSVVLVITGLITKLPPAS